LVVALWGASFVVVRAAVASYPVVGFLFLRFLLGGSVLLGLAYLRRPDRPRWALVPKPALAAAGAALAAGYLAQTVGLALGAPVGVAATLTSLVVVLTPAWEWLIRGNSPDRRVVVSAVLAIGGTLLVCRASSSSTSLGHPAESLGIGLEVVSAVAFSLQVVLVGRLGRTLSATALGGAQLLMVALLLAPALPLAGGLPGLSRAELAAIVFSALGASAFGFAVQAAAQRHLTATSAAVIMATEPGFALVAAVAVGEQAISLLALLGLGLLLLGVLAQAERAWPWLLNHWATLAAGGRLLVRRQGA
jgi:drug/metabolite transporter (DMT)-like permease